MPVSDALGYAVALGRVVGVRVCFIIYTFKFGSMEYEKLSEGQVIEMFHHFNTENYFWKIGVVSVMSDGKYFLPRGMITKIRILPHRMDEIRQPG